jgi:uncharacterized protein YehS (DUF1456 family)
MVFNKIINFFKNIFLNRLTYKLRKKNNISSSFLKTVKVTIGRIIEYKYNPKNMEEGFYIFMSYKTIDLMNGILFLESKKKI